MPDKFIEFAGLSEKLTGMKIAFWIKPGIFWQCGRTYDAYDAKFNWLFLRDNAIPRYTSTWEYINDVSVIHDEVKNPHLEPLPGSRCGDAFYGQDYLSIPITLQAILFSTSILLG